MSFLARHITRQLVNRLTLHRHLSALPEANNRQNSGGKGPKSEWMKKIFVIASGIGSGFVIYSFIKTDPTPKVDAATKVEISSRRAQFSKLATIKVDFT